MKDDDIKDIAVHDFKIRTYGGFGLGIFTASGGVVLLIISIVRKQLDLIGISILIVLLGLFLSFVTGYFIFKKKNRRNL